MNDLLAFAVDAHGGLERWNTFSRLKAELSVDGAIWHLKQQPGLLNDKVFELDERIADYKSAGVKVIWIVDPKARTVRIIRPGVPTIELEEQQMLTGDPVLPGFSVLVANLFPSALPA